MAQFTEEQLQAIDAQGKIIVSASAGSGKTTVMIEKIIRLIRSGADVGEILAVTYTKKAAAQMKEKLRKAIVKAVNDPETDEKETKRLKKQLANVASADISTVHAFCAKFIRLHFYAAGVANNFRIISSDDADATALKNRAMDETFERAYEEKDEDFMRLLSVYFRKKSDNKLRSIFNQTYDALRTRANYRAFLKNAGNFDEDVFQAICERLREYFAQKCGYYLQMLKPSLDYFEENPVKGRTVEILRLLADYLTEVSLQRDLFQMKAIPFPQTPRVDFGAKFPAAYLARVSSVGFLKEKAKGVFDELQKFGNPEEELSRLIKSGETARAVAKFVLQFDDNYQAVKTAKGVLDYNDLEHIALRLLQDESIRAEMRGKYRYVFVDEYQDVNPVQEEIINAISGENVFLVGDVKQSIYGFRGSKSEYFVKKQRLFEGEDGARSLYLSKNFRSSDAVLNAVNAQFSKMMTLQNSDVDYQNTSVMLRGGLYEEDTGRVRVHFTGKEKPEKEEVRSVYSVREHTGEKQSALSLAAKKIKQIVETEVKSGRWYDADRKAYERVQYSDIAILSRNMTGDVKEIITALSAEGLPVTSSAAVNICDFPEVKTLIDLLRLVDNAAQDVPLATALLSVMGGLTEDDLVAVRLAYKDLFFFRDACKRYAGERTDDVAEKLRAFFAYLDKLRVLSRVANAGEVLTRIMADTPMEATLLGADGGERALKRIRRFMEESQNPEPLSVHDFLERLRMLDYDVEFSENAGENALRVMTMHASKGLEFPIVIVVNLSKHFHGSDRDEVLIDDEFSLAPKAFDLDTFTSATTVLRQLYDKKQQSDGIRDELNLYYVALTRAQYGLHMVFEDRISAPDARYGKSFAELTDFSVWEGYDQPYETVETPFFVDERQPIATGADDALTVQISSALAWEYLHSGCENLRVKSSATKLLQEEGDAEIPERQFFATDDGETDTERGLAYHAFLEKYDFQQAFACADGDGFDVEKLRASVRNALQTFQDEKAFDERYFPLLDVDKLTEIVANPVFFGLQGKKLYKEQQFLASIPACEVLNMQGKTIADGECQEEILFQGAIDLLAVDEQGATVVDYKYSRRGADGLKERYTPQLTLYKKAVARILKLDESRISCTIVNIFRGFSVDI